MHYGLYIITDSIGRLTDDTQQWNVLKFFAHINNRAGINIFMNELVGERGPVQLLSYH